MEVIMACHVVLSAPENLRRVMDEIVQDAAADGAVWVELSLWPGLFGGRLGSEQAALAVALDAGNAAAARHGIGFGLMVAANRHAGPQAAAATARLAAGLAGEGVVSFGLDGDEAAFPGAPFAEAFDIARSAGLLSTPHAGELLGPDSVGTAVDRLHADRILHGIRAAEDPALVARIALAGICLDVCPTSNAKLGVFELDNHPLPTLVRAGVTCSVNADDPLLFGAGLLDEYQLCRAAFQLSDEELAGIARASIQASGAPTGLKAAAGDGIDEWLAAGQPGTA
jgi:adenosine deaminase